MSRRWVVSLRAALLSGALLLPAALVVDAAPAAAAPKPKPKPGASAASSKGGGKDKPGTTAGPAGAKPKATKRPTPGGPAGPVRPAPPRATVAPQRVVTVAVPVRAPAGVRRYGPFLPVPSAAARPPRSTSPAQPSTTDDPTAPRRLVAVGEGLSAATRSPQLPLGVLGVMLAFLLVQARIDRKDPKLALAGASVDDDLDLPFGRPVRRPLVPAPPLPAPRPRLRVVARSPHHLSPAGLPGFA